jgi:hypothetical protein
MTQIRGDGRDSRIQEKGMVLNMNGGVFTESNSPMKIASLAGWMTLIIGFGIIAIGIREFYQPGAAARGFGVPLLDPHDGALLAIKAARDVAAGILALTFLLRRDRRNLALVMGVLTLIPVFDGLIVLRHAEWAFTPFILIHWGTAAFMIVIVALLRSGK